MAIPHLQDARVCNLEDAKKEEWDVDILRDTFIPRDVALILKVVVSMHYEDC